MLSFRLLHGRLLDEGLRLAVQVTRLRCRGSRHGYGSEQRCRCNELLTHTRWRGWVVNVEVDVDMLASLLA
jgi:hypothetical protein